jgi:hypothetical protein
LVSGYEWSFVATTREGRKTILWLEKGLGSATSPLRVYKTVWGLQRIARWAAEVFLQLCQLFGIDVIPLVKPRSDSPLVWSIVADTYPK